MGLYKFNIAAAASSSDIKSKITDIIGQGANIHLHSIVDIGNLNLSINDKNVTINYDLVGTKQNSLFNWYICDTVGYETIIILYDSGTESESTFGLANYNRVYFNVKNKIVSNPKISETLAAQFNVLRGRFDSYESDGGDDDVIMLTKCVYNNGSNIETGEAVVADNLYVSTNLRSTSFKTIVKDKNDKQFINIGGFFYLSYSEEIIYPSWSKKQWILPANSIDYEWHPATTFVLNDKKWYDTENNKNFQCYYSASINDNKKEFSKIVNSTNIAGSGLLYKNNEEIFQSSPSSLIYYIVVASKYTDTTHQQYLSICSATNAVDSGIRFFTDMNIIQFKVDNHQNNNTEYFSIGEDSLKYNVYAIKFNEFYKTDTLNYYIANASIYINGKHVRTFNDIKVNYYTIFKNSSIKYIGIVEHDQTSEEIIENSQLLMYRFGID